jgi:hypothetical protein
MEKDVRGWKSVDDDGKGWERMEECGRGWKRSEGLRKREAEKVKVKCVTER